MSVAGAEKSYTAGRKDSCFCQKELAPDAAVFGSATRYCAPKLMFPLTKLEDTRLTTMYIGLLPKSLNTEMTS